MRLTFFAVCDSVIVDARTNRVSAINILDELSSPHYPAVRANIGIIAIFARDTDEEEGGECSLRFSIGRDILLEGSVPVEFAGAPQARAIVHLNALMIPRAGEVMVRLMRGQRTLSKWNILAQQVDT